MHINQNLENNKKNIIETIIWEMATHLPSQKKKKQMKWAEHSKMVKTFGE